MEIVVQLIAIVLSAWVVAWQVGKQFRQNRELQKDEHKDRLFLEMFHELEKMTQVASSSEITARGYAQNTLNQIEALATHHPSYSEASFFELRVNVFHDYHQAFSRSVVELVGKLESVEIIHQDFDIFRLAFGSAFDDLTSAAVVLNDAYLGVLPADVPVHIQQGLGFDVYRPEAPTQEQFNRIKPLTDDYLKACDDIGSYIHDLRNELQNLLLGRLFSHRISRRKPIDPSAKVIALEPKAYVDGLRHYFLYETPSGKSKLKAESDARRRFEATHASFGATQSD